MSAIFLKIENCRLQQKYARYKKIFQSKVVFKLYPIKIFNFSFLILVKNLILFRNQVANFKKVLN